MSRWIGVLLDHKVYLKVPSGQTGHEKLSLYHKAAKANGLSVVFFSLEAIRFSRKTVKGWVREQGGYQLTEKPIPSVVHNRSMPFRPDLLERLQKLKKHSIVFNPKTRYAKNAMYRMVRKNEQLKPYLPATSPLSKDRLDRMKQHHKRLFVKPQIGSLGKHIFTVKKTLTGYWKLKDGRQTLLIENEQLYSAIRRKTGSKKYLLQEHIPLATYYGKPYDIRISVQKDGSGQWKITGMVGKVARKGSFVTNVARGGKVKRVEELLKHSGLSVEDTIGELERFSLRLVHHLETLVPRIADVGLDVGITKEGSVKLIEVNGRDQRYSFKKAGMPETWRETYKNPVAYAKYLLTNGKKR